MNTTRRNRAASPFPRNSVVPLLAMLVAITLAPLVARARQCTPALQSAIGLSGTNGIVRCTTVWDPDGPGPLPPRLIVGGSFVVAGSTFARGLIAWDGTHWIGMDAGLPVPSGSTGSGPPPDGVYSLASLPSGELFAAVNGRVPYTGGGVFRWTGASWSAIGITGGEVLTLAPTPTGDLLVGGSFFNLGGVVSNCIIRWNGTGWSPMGLPLNQSEVFALAVASNGDVIAGGRLTFDYAPPSAYFNVARWNGSAWSMMGAGLSGSGGALSQPQVRSLLALPNGDIIAAGAFTASDVPVRNIARWNGSSWSPVGDGYPGGSASSSIRTLIPLANGHWLVGGTAAAASSYSAYAARWDGQSWNNLGSGMQNPQSWGSTDGVAIHCLTAMPNGSLIAGGSFTAAGAQSATCISQWDGASWQPLTKGIGSLPFPQTQVDDAGSLAGDLVISGKFSEVEGVPAANIARRTSTGWMPLGSGLGIPLYPYGAGTRLKVVPNGDLFVSGPFTIAGGIGANHIARWDGASWHALGAGFPNNPLSGNPVYCMTGLPAGDLVAAGSFTQAGTISANNIARWNGSDWFPLGAGLGATNSEHVSALLTLPSGDLIAGGTFTAAGGNPAGGIARWDGSAWSAFGTGVSSGGYVSVLIALSNGDIVAAGNFTAIDGVPAANIARWNGQAWSPFGTGLPGGNSYGYVSGVSILPSGDVIACGLFSIEGALQGYDVARWDGHRWSPLSTELIPLYAPSVLLTLPTNGVIVAGSSPAGSGGSAVFSPNGFLMRLICTPCYPNCDSSTSPPLLNANDFQCFLNKFAAADSYANCDHSTNPPTLNANDFQCFLNAFAAGCP